MALGLARCAETRRLAVTLSRSAAHVHYQAGGGAGERANSHVNRRSFEQEDVGTLLAYSNGSEAALDAIVRPHLKKLWHTIGHSHQVRSNDQR